MNAGKGSNGRITIGVNTTISIPMMDDEEPTVSFTADEFTAYVGSATVGGPATHVEFVVQLSHAVETQVEVAYETYLVNATLSPLEAFQRVANDTTDFIYEDGIHLSVGINRAANDFY
jgi:hypothetical protein